MKKIKSLILLLLIISLCTVIINNKNIVQILSNNSEKVKNAENIVDSYNLKLEGEKIVNPGNTLIITLKLTDIDIKTGENGLGSYQGKIEYDANIFENLEILSGSTEWATPYVKENKFVAERIDGKCINTDQNVAIIKLKVKEDATLGNCAIKVVNFKASNGTQTI